MIETTAILFRAGFMCQACQQVFKSVEKYCSHKVEFHFSQLTKSSCILFKESIVEATETGIQLINFGKFLLPLDPQVINNELFTNPVVDDVKLEPPEDQVIINDPVKLMEFTNLAGSASKDSSAINTNCLEGDTEIKCETFQPQHEDAATSTSLVSINSLNDKTVNNNNYYDRTYTQLNFSNADAANADPKDEQLEDRCIDPLEDFDVTQSTPSSLTRTTETAMEYIKENNSDSDGDIICLDDPLPLPLLLPSTVNKFPISARPITAKTSSLNSVIRSQLKLQCQNCYRKFRSSAHLGIHVARCQLQNSKQKTRTSSKPGPGPAPGPASVVIGVSVGVANKICRGRRRDVLIKCDECKRLIKRPYFERHVKSHETLNTDKSPAGFVCEICGYAFTKQCYLDVHARVHSTATPFPCTFPNCGAAFKFQSNVYRHLKTHTKFGELQE